MAELEDLLYEANAATDSMSRLLINLKKVGQRNFTVTVLQTRLNKLNQTWDHCQALDVQIYKAADAEERKTLPYFKDAELQVSEQIYWEVSDYISTAISKLTQSNIANVSNAGDASVRDGNRGNATPLPRIPLPTFSGSYTEWVSFRDLFESLVIKNDQLSNVEKLHYLKVSVTGDASSLLTNITITETNFQVAWDALLKRYDRSRYIIEAQLVKLYDVSAVSTENASDLKNLRDQTSEAVSALSNLGRSVDTWDDLLAFMTIRKLDPVSRREWEMRISEKEQYPTYEDIINFLEYRIRALESIPSQSVSKPRKQSATEKGKTNSVKSHLSTSSKCCDCNGEHSLYKCEQFKNKTVEQRQKIVREKQLCYNCLSTNHRTKQCPSKHVCFHCKKKHHTLMHSNEYQHKQNREQAQVTLPSGNAPAKPCAIETSTPNKCQPAGIASTSSVQAHHALEPQTSANAVMLATAWVQLEVPNGRSMNVRALLDQGSQSSFLTESVAQTLRAPRRQINSPISGIGGAAAGVSRSAVTLTLKPCNNDNPSLQCEALVFQRLTSYVPKGNMQCENWTHLIGLDLADPDPSSSDPIQLILGADIYANILCEGLRRGPPGSPIAQRTIFGWVLSGPTGTNTSAHLSALSVHLAISESNLSLELRRFWELEEVPTCSPLTDEEKKCEAHFAATYRRLPEGRYCVKLPFKRSTAIKVGASSQTALNWMLKLERKFTRQPELATPYRAFMQQYSDLGHMIQTSFRSPESDPGVFLPHHPVIKDSSTTRLRVVFNASSRTSNGTSLNDHLMVGPRLQADLPAIILKWRVHQYAFTADITKMYRQILVDADDTRYQQILWRDSPSVPISPYRLVTVTYGTASAPYLAMRVLKQLADDEKKEFPRAAPIVRQQFYVDDALFGANDEITATSLRQELVELLARGGFTLRKWMASHPSLLENIPIADREVTKVRNFDASESIKVLGIGWVPETDLFCFNATWPERDRYTKRIVLSVTAKLFDPLGWLSPVLIIAKIIIQELWIASSDWDEELPSEMATKWKEYYSSIPDLQTVSMPRWNHLESNDDRCQLHGFADASTRAYAAVIYLRIIDKHNKVHISLLTAKAKVAPIKSVSVPRLELCAAALLAKLLKFVLDTMLLTSCTTHAWTDSTVVLSWRKQHPSKWPTFVANRVASIQTLLPEVPWNHVPTEQNPADCASRGLLASELSTQPLWWHGPPWLQLPESLWPRSPEITRESETAPENFSHIATEPAPKWELPYEVSSWPRLLRITAYCIRFAARCKRQTHTATLSLSGDEVVKAKHHWIKVAQSEFFQDDINALQSNLSIPRKSSIRKLNPFLDEYGLLLVGGRLQRSPLSFDEKHPIILPKHRITTLIVEHAHLRSLHGGPQLTISVLRQNYWIIGQRPFVRNIIHKCVPCVRERATVPTQLMGNLPAARTTLKRPFQHSGLDYAGPFQVRTAKGRGHKSQKAYLALFVCLSTRAIHLELVSDYSSEAFLAAFRRFVSRRGLPSDLYSDNGTTFIGADKELQSAYRNVIRDPNVANLLATDQVKWHFIPPGALHFGGMWEAGVKCTKHHLRRVIGSKTLTFEEFTTLTAQIEACLNSRPIGPFVTDPCDFSALTPGHLLIGAPLTSVPEPSLVTLNENRLSRWQLVRQMFEVFWKRWSAEYLHSLQVRTKWTQSMHNVKIGDLVLVKNENLPPAKWLLARITACHPGPDGLIRVVSLKTSQSEFKRPITKLCVLPLNSNDSVAPPESSSSDDTSFQDCADSQSESSSTINDL